MRGNPEASTRGGSLSILAALLHHRTRVRVTRRVRMTRRSALLAAWAMFVGIAGCGRIGYVPLAQDSVVVGDGTMPPSDAIDAALDSAPLDVPRTDLVSTETATDVP